MVTEELLRVKEEMLRAREIYNEALINYKDKVISTLIDSFFEGKAYYCLIDGNIRRIKVQKSDYFIFSGLVDLKLQELPVTDVETGEHYSISNGELLVSSLRNPNKYVPLRKYIDLNVNLF